MCSSWGNVILSWVNVCGISTIKVETLNDLANGKLLNYFLPSDTRVLDDQQRLTEFIDRHYPGFRKPYLLSELKDEELLIVYSLLVHYYSFIDDNYMRNKMCSLSPASQIQIMKFLECLLHKDITRKTVQMAIKSCGSSVTVKSLVEVYESSPGNSRKPSFKRSLQEIVNSPPAKQKKYEEIKKMEVQLQEERDARIYFEEQFEEITKEKQRMEAQKNEDIKRLERKLHEAEIRGEEISSECQCNYNAYQYQSVKIIQLKDFITFLEEKVANLTEENNSLSEKVTSLTNELSNWKFQEETLKANYLEAQQIIATKVEESFLLVQELAAAGIVAEAAEVAEVATATVVADKVDKDTSVTDLIDIEDLCPNRAAQLTAQVRDPVKKLRASDKKANLERWQSPATSNRLKRRASGDNNFFPEQHFKDCHRFHYNKSSNQRQVDAMDVIDESVIFMRRRRSVGNRLAPPGTVPSPYNEERSEFNARSLADLKTSNKLNGMQLNECQRRNAMVPPHLKSSYPVTGCKDLNASEDIVKFGVGNDLANSDACVPNLLRDGRKRRRVEQIPEQSTTPYSSRRSNR